MPHTIPKFPKVEIIEKANKGNSLSSIKTTFEDCGLMISGDYLILTIEKTDGTIGKVYNLKDVDQYKTYNK
jgi:hypothetical protein